MLHWLGLPVEFGAMVPVQEVRKTGGESLLRFLWGVRGQGQEGRSELGKPPDSTYRWMHTYALNKASYSFNIFNQFIHSSLAP